MKTLIITNPNSGTAEKGTLLREHAALVPGVEIVEARNADEARQLARQGSEQFDTIAAAGGDGTIHSVINGMMAATKRARFAAIPLGTGNDFARTLAIPEDPQAALALALGGREVEVELDLVEARTASKRLYCVNVSAGGFSGQLEETLSDEMKSLWGPLSYLRGAAGVLPNLTSYRTYIRWDDGEPEKIEALNIIVANGRSAAKGFQVAPLANPQDGLLDIVIVRSAPLIDLVSVAAWLVRGDYVNHELVLYRRATSFSVSSTPGMWFSVDGELISNEPVSFRCIPSALKTVVGPLYTPEVAPIPTSPVTVDNT